jgi:hypothetical protein
MAITKISNWVTDAEDATTTNLTMALGTNTTVGNYIIVTVMNGFCGTPSESFSVSDNLNGSYTFVVTGTNASHQEEAHIYYVKVASGGATTVTVTHPDAAYVRTAACEFSGIDGTSPVEASSGVGGSSIHPTTTVSTAGEALIVSTFASNQSGTVTESYGTLIIENESPLNVAATYKIEASGGTYGENWTTVSASWGCAVAAFKAAAGGAGGSTPRRSPRMLLGVG